MTKTPLALLESALRARKLDTTLATALTPLERTDTAAAVATGVPGIDAVLGGGLPRGQLSEISGPCSSGRTTLLLSLMAAATRCGEITALIDTFDRFDTASAVAAGIDLDRLLWVRGSGVRGSGFGVRENDRIIGSESRILPNPQSPIAIDRALKALNLVLQAGGFGVVALDLADAALPTLRHIPFHTWYRVQRTIEGSDTACALLVAHPLARSAGGVTLALGKPRSRWMGASDRSRRLAGLDVEGRVVSPRRRVDGKVAVRASNDSA